MFSTRHVLDALPRRGSISRHVEQNLPSNPLLLNPCEISAAREIGRARYSAETCFGQRICNGWPGCFLRRNALFLNRRRLVTSMRSTQCCRGTASFVPSRTHTRGPDQPHKLVLIGRLNFDGIELEEKSVSTDPLRSCV